MADRYPCVACRKEVIATKNDRYRTHTNGDREPCEMGSAEISEHVLLEGPSGNADPSVPREGIDYAQCPQCTRKVKLTRLGYFEPHDQTLRGGDRCPVSGVRAFHARSTNDVLLPGDEPASPIPKVTAQEEITSPAPTSTSAPAESTPLALPSGSGPSSEKDPPATVSPESTTTSKPSELPATEPLNLGPYSLGTPFSEIFLQPFSPFLQPGEILPKIKLKDAMSDRGKEVASRLREVFYAYTNRNSSDNRSAQRTIGPSEAGSPCDRQLAMKMLGIKPVNPQESWAPFVGTAVHAELAKMFEWANGSGSGRYEVEMALGFGSAIVPRGTGDLLDRVLFMFLDHKLMGRWSLNKLVQEGPSDVYRIQVQIYGLGAVLAGEKVREVAIVGWPRQESSLDNLFVHVEPFDRKVAEAALRRVERIAGEVEKKQVEQAQYAGLDINAHGLRMAQEFGTADRGACKWCPFSSPKDKGFQRGCPGPS